MLAPTTLGSIALGSMTLISLGPAEYVCHQINETFTLNLIIENVANLWSWKTAVTWDSAVLDFVGSPQEGEFLGQGGSTLFPPPHVEKGSVPEISSTLLSDSGVSGTGVLASLTFRIKEEVVRTTIHLVNSTLLLPVSGGSTHQQIAHVTSDTTVSLIMGNKPVAHAGEDRTVNEDVPVVLNGSGSMEVGTNITYVWTIEGQNSTMLLGQSVVHTFDIPGKYKVTLTVSNSQGDQSNDTIVMTVNDTTPPSAVIQISNSISNDEVKVGQSVTFSGSGSYDSEGGKIASWYWDFSDGSHANGTSATHTFNQSGSFNVTLTVADEGGNSNSQEIRVYAVQGASEAFQLPPIVLVTLASTTLVAVVGSFMWLRKAKYH